MIDILEKNTIYFPSGNLLPKWKFTSQVEIYFPSGNNYFPSGNNYFPSGNNYFPSGNIYFPSGNNSSIFHRIINRSRTGKKVYKTVYKKVYKKYIRDFFCVSKTDTQKKPKQA
jgi:hypothetical protein